MGEENGEQRKIASAGKELVKVEQKPRHEDLLVDELSELIEEKDLRLVVIPVRQFRGYPGSAPQAEEISR